MRLIALSSIGLLTLACAGGPSPEEPTPAEEPRPPVRLSVLPLAGQNVIVMPSSHVVAGEGLAPAGSREALLAWSDSILGEALRERAPEVNWTLPPELRRIARRAPGMAGDPDRMGQALLRNERLDRVPDPLRSNLRTLAALADARYVLVPATVILSGDAAAPDARVMAVLVDVRTGGMPWRQVGRGSGTGPAAAYAAALRTLLPEVEAGP